MRRVLLDLNVLLDVLLDREPHAEMSAAIWAAIEERRLDGALAAHGLTTIFYLVAKQRGRVAAREVVADLLAVFGIAAVDEVVLRRAVALDLADFEDAVAAAAAEAAACDAIVTRDLSGFRGSPVQALEPLLVLAALDAEIHEPAATYGKGRRRRGVRRAAAATRRG